MGPHRSVVASVASAAKMRSSRMGSKGTEWLLIKKKDEFAKPGSGDNLDKLDYSVLTKRSLNEIAGDKDSAEWQSNRKAAKGKDAEWLNAAATIPKAKPAQKERTARKKTASAGNSISKRYRFNLSGGLGENELVFAFFAIGFNAFDEREVGDRGNWCCLIGGNISEPL